MNFSGVEFLKNCSQGFKKKVRKSSPLAFASLTKREIEQFHVVVVKCKVFFFLIKPIAFFADLVTVVVSSAPYYYSGRLTERAQDHGKS